MSAPPPLAGIRVLELTHYLAGPYCTLFLADLGADVIKIESPAHPDLGRGMPGCHVNGAPAYFHCLNRNKRSVALDLKAEPDRAAFYRLVGTADVVVDNFRHGVMGRLGADPPSLRQVNDRLVTCSLTGFGATGPRRDLPGVRLSDPGDVGNDEPHRRPGREADEVRDLDRRPHVWAPRGLCDCRRTAIRRADRSRVPRRPRAARLARPHAHVPRRRLPQLRHGARALRGLGTPVHRAVATLLDERRRPRDHAHGRCHVGAALRRARPHGSGPGPRALPQRSGGSGTASGSSAPSRRSSRSRETASTVELLRAHGVPAAPVNTVPQILADPQIEARDMIVEAGGVKMLGNPVKLPGVGSEGFRAAPAARRAHPRGAARDRAVRGRGERALPDELIVESSGPVVRLTLNRPERRNALTPELIARLLDELAGVEANAEARVVVLAGAGNAFCAGYDIDRIDSPGRSGAGIERDRVEELCSRVRRLRQPVIASVSGAAFGAGCDLAVSCDLRLASTRCAALDDPGAARPPLQLRGDGAPRVGRGRGVGKGDAALGCGGGGRARRAARPRQRRLPAERLAEETDRVAEAIAANAPLSVQASKIVRQPASPTAPLSRPSCSQRFRMRAAASGRATIRRRGRARFASAGRRGSPAPS